jgi:hypothetical protein
LLAERLISDCCYSLFNRRLTQRYADGRVEGRTLAGVAELIDIPDTILAISPPADPETIWTQEPKE